MGKVTSTIYTAIYLVVGGAILAIGAQVAAAAWALLALAAAMATLLAAAGDRLDAMAGQHYDAGAAGGRASGIRRPDTDRHFGRPAA